MKKIKELLRMYFASFPLWNTKRFKDRVLDLGCGVGFYFKINPLAYGVDVDAECITYLQDKGYKVIQKDIRKELPFSDNFFKCVICHDILEHLELEDAKNVFFNVHRILETGGAFLIFIPNLKGFEYGLKTNASHKYFITPKEIFSIGMGIFSIEKHYSYPLPRFIGDYFTHNKEFILLKKC
jgi:SAM-dependent methyltransferase